MIEIHAERPGDETTVYQINQAAFGRDAEAELVDKLRAGGDYLAFVAVIQGEIVGHIAFTLVTIDGSSTQGMGLGPVAVLPAHQRQGVGGRLIRHGLHHVREAGWPFVVVLGHSTYYPHFGFAPASRFKLRSQWPGVPDEAFMAILFAPDALPAAGGVVRYRPAFDDAT
jgi:putative acetyltransferase